MSHQEVKVGLDIENHLPVDKPVDNPCELWISPVDNLPNGVSEGQNLFTKALLRGLWITYTQVIHRRLWITRGCG
jgi:hypothetical protein